MEKKIVSDQLVWGECLFQYDGWATNGEGARDYLLLLGDDLQYAHYNSSVSPLAWYVLQVQKTLCSL
jgi:hypothetical protein